MFTKKVIAIAVIALLLAGVGYWLYANSVQTTRANLDEFAKCLAEKNAIMYGAEWCPHCQNEKAAFGESFQYVPYVECPENIKVCTELGIKGYPTWILGDGARLEGEQGLEKLFQATGCALP